MALDRHRRGRDEALVEQSGQQRHVVRGQFFEEGETRTPWVGNSVTRVESHSLLGVSPVFRVEKRPRLEIVQADVEEPLEWGLLGRQGRQRMIVVDEPAACATAPNDVSELGGVTHPTDLVTYRVRLYADPAGQAEFYVYNPKYVVYRQGNLAKGPVGSDHWNEIWKREIWASNFYRNGITVRPPGENTTYASSGGPPVDTYISLDFDSSDRDQWQTISVNVRCADHDDHNAYIIQPSWSCPGSVTLMVSTTGDDTSEADGSVTATVNDGSDYTVSASEGAATVVVSDDDSAGYTINPAVVAKVRALAAQTQHGAAHVNR